MVIDLTPEVEALLHDSAKHEGSSVEEVIKNAVLWYAKMEEEDRASIQRGIDQADRGEFISQEEMDRRFERMIQPR
jgi:predicted transcriptional regulator